MQNAWKGLVVGGLTGVVAGVALDALIRAQGTAGRVSRQVVQHAPDAGKWAKGVVNEASERVHDSDIPDRVRHQAHRVLDSDIAQRTVKVAADAAASAKELG
jgi:hypothetical protein